METWWDRLHHGGQSTARMRPVRKKRGMSLLITTCSLVFFISFGLDVLVNTPPNPYTSSTEGN